MTTVGFITRNALRNKRRAALTILSVAVSCALLVTLLTLERELTIPPESEAASLQVIARNKVSYLAEADSDSVLTPEASGGLQLSQSALPIVSQAGYLTDRYWSRVCEVVTP